MFISVCDLFKIGVGPSSSHTMGPMLAAKRFIAQIQSEQRFDASYRIKCLLKGSLAYTGKGHKSDQAVMLGLNGYSPEDLISLDLESLKLRLLKQTELQLEEGRFLQFEAEKDIVFDTKDPIPEHPNGMVFQLLNEFEEPVIEESFVSIGGGFIQTVAEFRDQKPTELQFDWPYPFESADAMIQYAKQHQISIAQMKRENELSCRSVSELDTALDAIWSAMYCCVENGLKTGGVLPGGLGVKRRAKDLFMDLKTQESSGSSVETGEWLCAYAMAVNEENAAGNMVVTAPTNGAAGVIPATLYYMVKHHGISIVAIREYLLVASAIGGLIKYNSSISGAELGCQGEVGSASAMAAAGICAIRGGTSEQIENAAEIALEHHLGLTCDPVGGLVQVPCIERNGFGAVKAITAASLALRGSGDHIISLDACIQAMKETGEEMSTKFKETALGGLAVSYIEC